MEAMDFDTDALLTSTGSDPMLGTPPDPPPPPPSQTHSGGDVPPAQQAPTGSFIVLKNPPGPGMVGKVTQLGNINFSNLQPGQTARAAAGRLTAVMGRPAGSNSGGLTKFITISPSGSQASSTSVSSQHPTQQRIALPGQHHVRMVQPVPNTGGHGVKIVSASQYPPQYRPVQPDTLGSPAKTITLTPTQAQEMGLLSPRKVGETPRQLGSPHRIIIRSSPSTHQKSMVASSGQTVRFVAQNPTSQGGPVRPGIQFVRVVGSGVPRTAATQASFQQHQQQVVQQQQHQQNEQSMVRSNHATQPALKIAIAPSQPSQRLLLPATPLPPGYPGEMGSLPPAQRPPPSRPPPHRRSAAKYASRESLAARAAQVGKPTNWGDSGSSLRPRKPCNCTKSQCLKLYCDCFAAGEFCNNCNCTNCNNSLNFEEERQRAIRACLDRNPYAFKPKIGKSDNETRKHQKGCNCKKSGCLKNYCECYEAKIFCSSQCKCMGCKNHETAASSRLSRPGAESVSSLDDNVSSISSDTDIVPIGKPGRKHGGLKVATFPVSDRTPIVRVTQDVIDATIQCLMTESCEDGDTELRVLNEFGRCISQIIDFSSRRGDAIDGMV